MEEEKELELLPPNKRYVCPDCKKKFSKLQKCRDGIKRCQHCKNKIPTNKFYIPKEKRNQFIGNFYITDKEKELLHKHFMLQGCDSIQAWNRVNKHIRILRAIKRRRRKLKTIKRNREMKKKQEIQEQKKKFLEGLK